MPAARSLGFGHSDVAPTEMAGAKRECGGCYFQGARTPRPGAWPPPRPPPHSMPVDPDLQCRGAGGGQRRHGDRAQSTASRKVPARGLSACSVTCGFSHPTCSGVLPVARMRNSATRPGPGALAGAAGPGHSAPPRRHLTMAPTKGRKATPRHWHSPHGCISNCQGPPAPPHVSTLQIPRLCLQQTGQ